MRRLQESNIAPSAPSGVGDPASADLVQRQLHGGSSFRLRPRPTALDLLINRGLSNWYPESTDCELLWKDEEKQIAFEQKMHVLLTNSHVFQQFKDRVAASESFANPMAARLVLEEFLEQELLFVGKRGVIHRHSELIKHLALSQRSLGVATCATTTTTNGKMCLRKPALEKNIHQTSSCTDSSSSDVDFVKSDSVTAEESSDSSVSEEFANSPFWSSPLSGKTKTTVAFSGMKKVTESLGVPELEGKDKDNEETILFEASFVN